MSEVVNDVYNASSAAKDDDSNAESSANKDRFTSLDGVRAAIKAEGLESCRLIFGIDYAMSNLTQGKNTFGGKNLHDLESLNPYQEVSSTKCKVQMLLRLKALNVKKLWDTLQVIFPCRYYLFTYKAVICILGEVLEPLNSDTHGIIPAFGFGDSIIQDKGIFKLKTEEVECSGFMDVLEAYEKITPKIKLSGPSNFAPLIEKAVEIVKRSGNMYHILVIVANGQVSNEEETRKAIENASDYPLSIIMIGVGDGPFDMMDKFDDLLQQRRFDNFQFVNFHKIMSTSKNPQAALALSALMEIPDQYKSIKNLSLMKK